MGNPQNSSIAKILYILYGEVSESPGSRMEPENSWDSRMLIHQMCVHIYIYIITDI